MFLLCFYDIMNVTIVWIKIFSFYILEKHGVVIKQPKKWMFERSYIELRDIINDLERKVMHMKLILAISKALLLIWGFPMGEGVYKLYLHCKHFDFMRMSNGR